MNKFYTLQMTNNDTLEIIYAHCADYDEIARIVHFIDFAGTTDNITFTVYDNNGNIIDKF